MVFLLSLVLSLIMRKIIHFFRFSYLFELGEGVALLLYGYFDRSDNLRG